MKDYKIAVAGTGYVGLSIATLLSQHHEVMAVDIIPEKVDLINHKKSPIQDEYIEKYLAEKKLNLTATLDAETAYKDADFVVIAAPTNYDSKKNFFDTSAVESVIKLVIQYNPDAIMVIAKKNAAQRRHLNHSSTFLQSAAPARYIVLYRAHSNSLQISSKARYCFHASWQMTLCRAFSAAILAFFSR